MITVGIDPGLVATGWSRFDGKTLVAAGLVRGNKDLDTSDRVLDIAVGLWGACLPLCHTLIVERMAYRREQKVNPEILLALNLLAGTCIRLCASEDIHFVQPQVWKGRAEKSVHISRVRLTLTPDERSIVEAIKPASLQHNAWDAVGLGLYALDRLTPSTRSIKR